MIDFFKNILLEFRNITWLNKQTLFRYTVIVTGTSIAISIFLFINDLLFSQIIILLLKK